MSTDIQKKIEAIKHEGALIGLEKHYRALIRSAQAAHNDIEGTFTNEHRKAVIKRNSVQLKEAEATLDTIIEMEASTK